MEVIHNIHQLISDLGAKLDFILNTTSKPITNSIEVTTKSKKNKVLSIDAYFKTSWENDQTFFSEFLEEKQAE